MNTSELTTSLPTPPMIPKCDTCGWLHDRNEPCPAPPMESREVFAADEIPFDVALEVVNSSGVSERLAAARKLFRSLYSDIKELNPIVNEHGKYLNLEISAHGYDEPDIYCRVYFGQPLSINNVETLEQITEAVNVFNPEAQKAKRVSELRAELAKLESEVQS